MSQTPRTRCLEDPVTVAKYKSHEEHFVRAYVAPPLWQAWFSLSLSSSIFYAVTVIIVVVLVGWSSFFMFVAHIAAGD
jgi:hypothetical protein